MQDILQVTNTINHVCMSSRPQIPTTEQSTISVPHTGLHTGMECFWCFLHIKFRRYMFHSNKHFGYKMLTILLGIWQSYSQEYHGGRNITFSLNFKFTTILCKYEVEKLYFLSFSTKIPKEMVMNFKRKEYLNIEIHLSLYLYFLHILFEKFEGHWYIIVDRRAFRNTCFRLDTSKGVDPAGTFVMLNVFNIIKPLNRYTFVHWYLYRLNCQIKARPRAT